MDAKSKADEKSKSEEKSKGLSLRTKRTGGRPKISAPTLISGPIPQTATGLPVGPSLSNNGGAPKNIRAPQAPPIRPQASGKTTDLVKRRYSTRFNTVDYNQAAPPMPSLPSLTSLPSINERKFSSEPPRFAKKLVVNFEALSEPDFDADRYVTETLADATEEEIDQFKEDLVKFQSSVREDLNKQKILNSKEFIKISKLAKSMMEEMRVLKSLMKELKQHTSALQNASSSSIQDSDAEFTKDRRNSILDRSNLWNNQLQALYKLVGGAVKVVPPIPGRHIIQNAGTWQELDNATWNPKRDVQVVLLNDHLLLAVQKRKIVDGEETSQSFVEHCWPLLGIEMVDLADTKDTKNGFKVRHAIMIRGVGQSSFTYSAHSAEGEIEGAAKAPLLRNFRRCVEELRKEIRIKTEAANQAKNAVNYFASRDPSFLQEPELLEEISKIRDVLIEVDGKQENLRWIESQVDELDIEIALQKFEAGVQRVEKLTALGRSLKSNAVIQRYIKFKVEERATKLADLITQELIYSHNRRTKTVTNIGWLIRLDFEDRAREVYLETRGKSIQERFRLLAFEGNLPAYICQTACVYFQMIHHTAVTFEESFSSDRMSANVKWAKEQVDKYNDFLGRQLSTVERDGPIWAECITQTTEQATVFVDAGFHGFAHLIGNLLENSNSATGPVGLGLQS